jgi:hypothetical protein
LIPNVTVKWVKHLLCVPYCWIPSVAVKWVTLLLYVLEVTVSEQGSETGYFVLFLQLNTGRLQIGHGRFTAHNPIIINHPAMFHYSLRYW